MKPLDSGLKVILLTQLVVLVTIGLTAMGFPTFSLFQAIGFIYFTFIPGFLLLKAINFRASTLTDTVLYSVGLSIAILITTVLLMNGVYPAIGVSNPISLIPIVSTISFLVSLLCLISYLRQEKPQKHFYLSLKNLPVAPGFFLCSIPVLSVLGTLLVSYNQSGIVLLIALIMIPLVAILVVANKFVPKSLYPFAIIAIALALFYQFTLMSPYLTGADINNEYYFVKLVTSNSIWISSIANNYNAMASIVVLNPVYSITLFLDNAWVFKIIYPLIFSLVPLALYSIYKKQMNQKLAFLSVFFFLSLFTVFTEMMALARQQIAELFLVLVLLTVVDRTITSRKGMFLCLFFAAMIVLSHYGLTYLFLFFFLLLPSILIVIIKRSIFTQFFQNIFRKLSIKRSITKDNSIFVKHRLLSATFILFFSIFTITWYWYVSNSSALFSLVSSFRAIFDNISIDLFGSLGKDPFVLRALGGALTVESWQREAFRWIQYLTEAFIIIGTLKLLWRPGKTRFTLEYFIMMICAFGLLFASVFLPYFASSLNATRIYQITLIFLAPTCVIGGTIIFKSLEKVICQGRKKSLRNLRLNLTGFLVTAVLIVYFLFNSGIISEITNDVPFSITLNPQKLEVGPNVGKTFLNTQYIFETQVFSSIWLSTYKSANPTIYADYDSRNHVLLSYGNISTDSSIQLSNSSFKYGNQYIYLDRLNVIDGLINSGKGYFNSSQITSTLDGMNKIYTNGESYIYRPVR